MVNFRFHLVSLTAVFLALAAGIAIGAGVVDRQTVDFLEDRLRAVESNREETNNENDRLRADLSEWRTYAEQAGDRMVTGRLDGVPVMVMAVEGTDTAVVEGLRNTLGAAGSALQGSVWFTGKWALTEEEDVAQLAALVGASATSRPEDLRSAALSTLVSSWAAGGVAELAIPLRDAGFLDYNPPPGADLGLQDVALAGARVVVVSAHSADVPNEELGLPLVVALADAALPVLAGQPAPPEESSEPEAAPGLATVVRDQEIASVRISTVDNVDDYRGRIAVVFALVELGQQRTGHYGTGADAARLLPEPAP